MELRHILTQKRLRLPTAFFELETNQYIMVNRIIESVLIDTIPQSQRPEIIAYWHVII